LHFGNTKYGRDLKAGRFLDFTEREIVLRETSEVDDLYRKIRIYQKLNFLENDASSCDNYILGFG